MQLTPEIKQQLAEQKKQCVFCKIISKEIPGKVVFEDKLTSAVLDIHPARKGHTVFMLKEHYPIMPYIPAEEFKHYFGQIPALTKSIKKAMVTTGINIFIANGGAAGQQAPHFLIHFLPREEGDGFFNFLFKKNAVLKEEEVKMLAHNFPLMMQNHFQRNPAEWHQGKGNVPDFLAEIYENSIVIYEDEKTLCVVPEKGAAPGHLEIYSKQEEKLIENLSEEDSAHLFYVASFAATALFEGLKAHGTNIILKSGESDDNPKGRLCLHVLPRVQDDGLQKMLWEPKQPSYDLDNVASRIKDKTWTVGYKEEEKKEETITKSEVIKIKVDEEVTESEEIEVKIKEPKSAEEEIRIAVERVRR